MPLNSCLSGGQDDLLYAARKMSKNAVQSCYFSAIDNDENRTAVKVGVKDGEAREMRLPVQGTRTVLGSLTNRPLSSNVAVKAKQVRAPRLYFCLRQS